MKWWLILQSSVLKMIGLSVLYLTDDTLAGCVIFLSGGGWVLAHVFLPRAQGLCDVVTRFETTESEIWLTIDDGPDPDDTPAILDLLAAHGAQATFFLIGERAERYPELIDRIVSAGHSIGTHTHTHPMANFWCAGRGRVVRELDASLAVLNRSEQPVRLYRSPVGIKNFFLRRALRERSLHCVAWTIRSGDALARDVSTVVSKVEQGVQPGAIVLMHEGAALAPKVRVAAIRGVLDMLHQQGYRCVLPEAAQWRC